MTQQEFVSYLTERGWDEVSANSCYFRPIIDKSLSLEEWKNTLVGAYCSRSSALAAILHLANSLEKDVPNWGDLTLPNLAEYKDYVLRKVTHNTAISYMGRLASTMNIYQESLPNKNFRTILRIKREPSQHVALTEEEVERIHNYVPKTKGEHDIKRAFMIECLCGARHSDVVSLTEDNIKGDWLTYVSQKTKIETSVPVHRYLREYLRDKPYRDVYRRSTVLYVIKRICFACGIKDEIKIFTKGEWKTEPKWKFVGSHTARRSFATQLALRGVPVATISKLMGHSSTTMTSRYICIDKKDVGDVAMAFFS